MRHVMFGVAVAAATFGASQTGEILIDFETPGQFAANFPSNCNAPAVSQLSEDGKGFVRHLTANTGAFDFAPRWSSVTPRAATPVR